MTNESITQAEIIEGSAMPLDALKLRLAAQAGPWNWRSTLLDLARRIDAGEPLEDVVARLPATGELSCLLRESLSLADPMTFVLDAIRAREEVRTNWRAFMALVSYPIGMLLLATFVGAAFSYAMRGLVDFSGIEDFGLVGIDSVKANIDDQHAAMVGAALVVGWVALMLATIAAVGPPWAWTAVLGGFLIIGRPLRWVSLQEILHRFHLFAEQGVADGRIGHAVSRSFGSSRQAVVTASIARRIDAGMPIGQALASSMLSDGLSRPTLVLLDDQSGQTPQPFLRAARLLGRLAEERCRVLSTIMPVFLLAVVGTVLWSTISCYFMIFLPLVNMLSSLM